MISSSWSVKVQSFRHIIHQTTNTHENLPIMHRWIITCIFSKLFNLKINTSPTFTHLSRYFAICWIITTGQRIQTVKGVNDWSTGNGNSVDLAESNGNASAAFEATMAAFSSGLISANLPTTAYLSDKRDTQSFSESSWNWSRSAVSPPW